MKGAGNARISLGREADGGMCDGVGDSRRLMCYSDRRRGGASYFGQVGEWLNPIDCKSIALRATLVRT